MSRREFAFPRALPGFPAGSLPRACHPLDDAEAPWPHPLGRRAAVVLLFLSPTAPGGPAQLLFMRRSTRVRSHKGQIGFAGGRADAEDLSPGATARRELFEEVGIAADRVLTFGALPAMPSLDGSPVVAVVAASTARPEELVIAADEVDFVFCEPWTLYADGRSEEFGFKIFGLWRTSRVFASGAHGVWGLTAHLLHLAGLKA